MNLIFTSLVATGGGTASIPEDMACATHHSHELAYDGRLSRTKTQVQVHGRAGVDGDAWADARGKGFHKTGTNANLGNTEPRLTIRLWSSWSFPIRSCPVMVTSKMPEIPTDIRAPCAEKIIGATVVPGPRYGNSQQVGFQLGKAGKTGTRPRPQDPHPCRLQGSELSPAI
ncbi:hypothetical protein F5883DRAFT_43036 [Diaporthe sp. PMI_573]|nr:hypothetical protein F5883DRAFT_43036 [Diaporthaceae sp. PMI_573]